MTFAWTVAVFVIDQDRVHARQRTIGAYGASASGPSPAPIVYLPQSSEPGRVVPI
jgi:hypothetical protein